jgi:hypothetical protein
MIRRARDARRSRRSKDVQFPSPDEISRAAAEIRQHWSPKQQARRAGGSRRVQVMTVSAELFRGKDEASW